MHSLRIALDWTPNVNHIGLFVAKELGFYQEVGIDLTLVSPQDDNYQTTPGKKLELRTVDMAIAPFETVISLQNKENKVDALAIYALLQEDISSIATLTTTGIHRPKDLDGKLYASYKARYEDHIVQQLIKNDSGKGEMKITYPEKLGIWNTLLEGNADATWIFDNWEGVEALHKGIDLTTFSLANFGIPYGYSPVILTTQQQLDANPAIYTQFVTATQKGYQFCIENKEKAAAILHPFLTVYDQQNVPLLLALEKTIPYFGSGKMKPERVHSFLHWLVTNHLENEIILTQRLFTNELLEK